MSTYNFLPNGSFEDDTNWTLYNEAAYDTEHKVSGSCCLACSHNNFSGQQLQAIGYSDRVIAGRTYTLRFHQTVSASHRIGVYIIIKICDSYGYITSTKTLQFSKQVTGYVQADIEVPAGSELYYHLNVNIYTSASGTGETENIWIDDMQLQGDSEWFGPGDRGDGENLLVNGGFENNMGWYRTSHAVYDSNNAYSGNRCLAFPQNTDVATNAHYAYQTVKIVPGATYTLSYMAKTNENKRVSISYMYRSATNVPTWKSYFSRSDAYPFYAFNSFTFTVPSDAASDLLYIYIYEADSTDNAATPAYVDDIQLRGTVPSVPIYAKTNASTVNVRNAPSTTTGELTPFPWPQNRLAVVKSSEDSEWYETVYRGEPAYVMKEFMSTEWLPTLHDSIVLRMSAIADYEIGRNHSKWFDGYVDSENGQIISIDYCHAFVDWLAMHAGLPKERVPNTRNCNEAVIKWITSLGGVGSAFWFKSAEQKTRFRTNNLSAVGELIGNELTDAELQFKL